MKSVMDWVKANLPIVILSAVILLVLPAAFVGSHMWNSKIRQKREVEANKVMTDLNSLAISYTIPGVLPGETAKTTSMPVPNDEATKFYRENRKQLEDQITKVADVAKQVNQGDHKLLVDGLFVMPPAAPPEGATGATGATAATGAPPDPNAGAAGATGSSGATSVDPLKALELVDLIVGKGDKPSVYQQLLDSVHAGGPADPVKIAETIREMDAQAHEAIKAQSNRTQLTADEQKELTAKLVAARIGEYERHASQISVYATRDSLPAGIPRVAPSETPDPALCYEWQYDYWMVQDLLKAIDAANSAGGRKGIPQSVVKRIEKIDLGAPTGSTPPSVTGRKSGAENKTYDVRDASLTLVVSSSRLPELIDAISRSNFMTVIGISLSDVNPWTDLDQGYYYGSEHVVRAKMDIETIWLRSWTEPLMPQAFRDAINPAANPETAAAAAAPPPAASSRAARTAAPAEEPARGRGARNAQPPRKGRKGLNGD